MNLIEIRKNNGLTQKEAASLIGIPYRTYVRYEKDPSYAKTYKYKKIVEDLINLTRIDETHGILPIEKIREIARTILLKHDIAYCYLFGSYARGEAKEDSDIDLLIDTSISGLKFFELVEELRVALKKKIDLLRLMDLSSDNPIVLEILKDGIRII